jgi:hypothetical protein
VEVVPWEKDGKCSVDIPAPIGYNRLREENRQSRGQAERPAMRKVRAPQGKDNG